MDASFIYFDTSAIGLTSRELNEKGNQFSNELAQQGSVRTAKWQTEDAPRIKNRLAQFLGSKTSELAFIPNFSFGLSTFLFSLPKDFIVAFLPFDYLSITLPFDLMGFKRTIIATKDENWPNDDEIIVGLKASKPAIFVASHVQYQSGFKMDYKKIGQFCQENDILFILDATQSLGYEKYDFSEGFIDVLISSHYKWMNAGAGTGSMCIKESILKKYTPKIGGYQSYEIVNNELIYHAGIRSYEPGHVNMRGLIELEQAIIEKEEEIKQNCLNHQMELVKYFLQKAKEHHFEIIGGFEMNNRSPIVCIWDEEGILHKKLKSANIICTHRNKRIRFGFSPKNTREEIDLIFSV